MIASSLEWENKKQNIKEKMSNLPFNPDLRKMLKNIDSMVIALSKAEVNARRNKQTYNELPELKKINEAIQLLEQWIIMSIMLK